jgi:hypothetical protein
MKRKSKGRAEEGCGGTRRRLERDVIKRAVPEDFAVYGPIEGDLRLRKRYSCGGLRITAWRKETGILCEDPRARRGVPPKPKAAPKARAGRKPSPLTWYDEDQDDYSDVFDQLGIDRRGVIEW